MSDVVRVGNPDKYYRHLIGRRIELLYTSDPYTRLKSGDQGTVDFVDDAGTIFVKWDNGSGLGLVPGEDEYKIIE